MKKSKIYRDYTRLEISCYLYQYKRDYLYRYMGVGYSRAE